jgi:hypothetical protein
LLVAAVLLVALTGFAPSAAAAPACWQRLITDWYDGTIDNRYEIPCYQQAVDHLPTDAQLYSSARDDILRAMGQEIARLNAEATPTTTAAATTTEAPTTTEQRPPTTTEQPTTTVEEEIIPATTSPGRPKPKGVASALDKLNPGDADSFPLPLLILGALAILLVAAGVVGMIWRRMDRGDTDTGAGPA